jgi:hypothetical protein
MLHGIAADVEFWKPIVKEHWSTAPSALRKLGRDIRDARRQRIRVARRPKPTKDK